MRAVVIHAARDLRIESREPAPIGPGEVRVKIEAGGICGSDLHYFNDGGFGAIRLREPMILGHEIAGRITATGAGVDTPKPGDLVAVSPSRPCHACPYCLEKKYNHCLNMRFYGSAMVMPHVQGAFCDELTADATQCHPIGPGISAGIAALAEPLSVVLHAINRAGDLTDARVLITGCGPIGALCVLAAKARGAREVVVTDILDPVLAIATELGADRAINVATSPDWTTAYGADKGHFDVMFEASGNEAAIRAGLEVLRPLSTLVQIGMGGDVSLPLAVIVAREIDIRGTFRFHAEFAEAVASINGGALNLAPILSAQYPLSRAVEAFEVAGDRRRAMKVQLDFTT